MRHLSLFLLLTSLAGAAGCAGSKNFVLLRNPVTNSTVECPGETGVTTGSAAEMKSCVDTYKKEGYEEIYSY